MIVLVLKYNNVSPYVHLDYSNEQYIKLYILVCSARFILRPTITMQCKIRKPLEIEIFCSILFCSVPVKDRANTDWPVRGAIITRFAAKEC